MNIEQEIFEAYRLQNFEIALKLAKQETNKGVQSPQLLYILSECEMKIGDPSSGFSLCVKLAENQKSIVTIRRLVFWLDKTLRGYQLQNGSFFKYCFSELELEKIFSLRSII